MKRLARTLAPSLYNRLLQLKNTAVERRYLRVLRPLVDAVCRRFGMEVVTGPFSGMRLVPAAVNAYSGPLLLGSYESELHGIVESVSGGDFATVVDVGCAAGYYAIGLALRMPQSNVYAFDIDERARDLCSAVAAANGVLDRVTIGKECDVATLRSLVGTRTFVLFDCEGAEKTLLDPSLVPELAASTILVELHDCLDPSISPTILPKFAASHQIRVISVQPRDPTRYLALSSFSVKQRLHLLEEHRPASMQWAYMVPLDVST